MIIDDLAAQSEWVRAWCREAHIIQAPFPIFPEREEDGQAARIYNPGRIPRGLLPLRPGPRQRISARWARAPYPLTILIGSGSAREQGAIFVRAEAPCRAFSPEGSWEYTEGNPNFAEVLAAYAVTLVGGELCAWRIVFGVDGEQIIFAGPEGSILQMAEGQAVTSTMQSGAEYWFGTMSAVLLDVCGVAPAEYRPPDANRMVSDRRILAATRYAIWNVVEAIVSAFSLMHCRNVRTEEVVAPIALQRARSRRGKLPLYRYHVLKVAPFGERIRGGGAPQLRPIGPLVAIHFVRGHFKEYSSERPLFGKLTGLWWWQPHLAGRARRIVDKDYEIIAKKGN